MPSWHYDDLPENTRKLLGPREQSAAAVLLCKLESIKRRQSETPAEALIDTIAQSVMLLVQQGCDISGELCGQYEFNDEVRARLDAIEKRLEKTQ